MDSKKARVIMREHQSGFVKLNPRWCAIEKLIEDSEKLERIEKIVNAPIGCKHERYNKIKEVLEQE